MTSRKSFRRRSTKPSGEATSLRTKPADSRVRRFLHLKNRSAWLRQVKAFAILAFDEVRGLGWTEIDAWVNSDLAVQLAFPTVLDNTVLADLAATVDDLRAEAEPA